VNLVHGEKLVPTGIRRNSEMIVQFIHQSHMRDLFD
jgi:hypothetical protein